MDKEVDIVDEVDPNVATLGGRFTPVHEVYSFLFIP